MLQARDLAYRLPSLSSPKSDFELRGINLALGPGEVLLVLGRNGSGKTTLAKLLCGLLTPTSGDISIDGRTLHPSWRSRVGLVFQNPQNQIVGNSVIEDVAFGLENQNLPSAVIEQRCREALARVGLPSKATRSPHELSAGELQRLAIAAVLALEPTYIILDEPDTAIDVSAQRALWATLRDLKRAGHGILLISHQVELLSLADRVMMLNDGRQVFRGTPRELAADPTLWQRAQLEPPDILHLAYLLDGRFTSGIPALSPQELARQLLIGLPAASHRERAITPSPRPLCSQHQANEAFVIAGDALWYAYRNGHDVLRGISLGIPSGVFWGLTGPSGSGKSTLVQHFNGLLRARRGRVLYRGRDLMNLDASLVARAVGVVFQNPRQQLFCDSVFDEVAYGLRENGLWHEELTRRVAASLELVGLDPRVYSDRTITSLSGGEMAQVAIAAAVALGPEVLILDETLTALDSAGRDALLPRLAELCGSGTSVLIISHRLRELAQHASRIVVVREGRVAAHACPQELFAARGYGEIDLPPLPELMRALGLPIACNLDEARSQVLNLLQGGEGES